MTPIRVEVFERDRYLDHLPKSYIEDATCCLLLRLRERRGALPVVRRRYSPSLGRRIMRYISALRVSDIWLAGGWLVGNWLVVELVSSWLVGRWLVGN